MAVVESLSPIQRDMLQLWFGRRTHDLLSTGRPSPFVGPAFHRRAGGESAVGELTRQARIELVEAARFITRYGIPPDRWAPTQPDSTREGCPACSIGLCAFAPHGPF